MHFYKIMLVLALLLSLLVLLPQRAIAEPVEIEVKLPNIKVYAFEKVLDRWGEREWASFSAIIAKESLQWTVTGSHYPSGYTKTGIKSSAYGLGGFLDGTWQTVGCKKTPDKYKQIDCAIEYIALRYDTPHKALSHHKKSNWY